MLNKKLSTTILTMCDIDQRTRYRALKEIGIGKLHLRVREIDHKNTAQAKKIIKQYGWPSFTLVGKRASDAFWLIIQHADDDLKFQKHCLPYLKEAADRGEAYLKNVAYLTDRVQVSEIKKQTFGTQFRRVDGKLQPVTIMKAKTVND